MILFQVYVDAFGNTSHFHTSLNTSSSIHYSSIPNLLWHFFILECVFLIYAFLWFLIFTIFFSESTASSNFLLLHILLIFYSIFLFLIVFGIFSFLVFVYITFCVILFFKYVFDILFFNFYLISNFLTLPYCLVFIAYHHAHTTRPSFNKKFFSFISC